MLRYVTWLALYIILQGITYVLITPVLPLFACPRFGRQDNGNATGVGPRLPTWLGAFDTPDNDLFGDKNHTARWAKYPGYIRMVTWLYRNSLYGLKWGWLACYVEQPLLVEADGNPTINRNNGVTGVFRARYGGYWQWKCVKKLVGNRGIMFNFGWELDTAVKEAKPMTCLFMFSPRFVSIK